MYFADVVGQRIAKEELIRSFRRGIVPHARLLVGEDGAGALGIALAYARYINCSAPREDDACGECRSCRQYDSFAQQDLHFLFPIANVGSRNLCDDELPRWREFLARGAHASYADWLALEGGEGKRLQIFTREGEHLQEKLSYHIAEAKYRILLIWLPERMHEMLGNKLLKLVEEPPERTIVLMVTQSEGEVLGTLRSRMQALHLRPASEAEIAEALGRLVPRGGGMSADLAAHLARGNYQLARQLYADEQQTASEQTILLGRMLRATVNAKPMEMRPLADELATLGRETQVELLLYVSTLFREFYLYNLQIEQISYLHPTEVAMAKYLGGCISGSNIRPVQEELDMAIRHIRQNVNSRMVFFDLLLRLTSILAPAYAQKGIR